MWRAIFYIKVRLEWPGPCMGLGACKKVGSVNAVAGADQHGLARFGWRWGRGVPGWLWQAWRARWGRVQARVAWGVAPADLRTPLETDNAHPSSCIPHPLFATLCCMVFCRVQDGSQWWVSGTGSGW